MTPVVTPDTYRITIKDKTEILIRLPNGVLLSVLGKGGTYTATGKITPYLLDHYYIKEYPTVQTGIVNGKAIQYTAWMVREGSLTTPPISLL